MLGWVRAVGHSMVPVVKAGAYVFCLPCWYPAVGSLVIVEHVHYGRMIKRLVAYDERNNVRLLGEHPCSLSSAQMGWVPRSAIRGRVSWVVNP